ncbi:SH3 domain-containing protein [Chungangia koreensis]|uniref:SH3 domain-containing protein n=1 Tax=Chungangia koreensis TaxID=752657 RepID=A0ABV8X9Y9_9LACT
MAKQIHQYFENPVREYNAIDRDLQNRLNQEVYNEVNAYSQLLTDQAMEQVWNHLRRRYEELDRLEKSVPDEPSKEDRDYFLKQFFKLTDPSHVSADLQRALQFKKIEKDYAEFIKKMSLGEYGELFKRYRYPAEFFNGIQHGILHSVDNIVHALKSYAESVGRYALTLDSVAKSAKDKAFIKGTASVLGLLVGIPFAGAGVGALMGGSDQSKISDSLDNVFEDWDEYVDHFYGFLQTLEQTYRLAMAALYGGTILRVNDQLNQLNIAFSQMALLSKDYALELNGQERKETEKWLRESVSGIKQLLTKKLWKDAIRISQELYLTVKSQPVAARTEMYGGKSAIYEAHLYYYLSFQEALLEEYQNGHYDSFYTTVKKLYSDMPLTVLDKNIDSNFSKTGDLLFRFIKEALKRDRTEDLLIAHKYLERVGKRWKRDGSYLGETTKDAEAFTDELKAFYLLENFLYIQCGYEIEFQFLDGSLKRRQIRELIKIDEAIGRPDSLTDFLKFQYRSALFHSFKTSLTKNKKWLVAAVLAIGVGTGGFVYGNEIVEKAKGISLFADNSEAETEIVATAPIYLMINTEYANVRSEPSLSSSIVDSVDQSIQLEYLHKEATDSEYRTWLLVKLPDGKDGWISSKITENIAQ